MRMLRSDAFSTYFKSDEKEEVIYLLESSRLCFSSMVGERARTGLLEGLRDDEWIYSSSPAFSERLQLETQIC
jgi:hypothetical protein